jgi:hypothetical protein
MIHRLRRFPLGGARRTLTAMLDWLPPGTELMRDVSPADWVLARLQPWDLGGVRLHSFAPSGFEAYARIFHPARYRPAFVGALDPDIGIRWASLGAERGIALSPDVAFCEVSGIRLDEQDRLDEIAPADGELPPATCEALARVLRPHTATPATCWFCLWEGHGSLWSTAHTPLYPDEASATEIERYRALGRAQDEFLEATPRVRAEARSYFLCRGPLEAGRSFEPDGWYLSPNLWWPDDRSWIVVTEVDGYSSYLGGTPIAIADVIASSEIEATEVTLDVHMDPGPYPPRWRQIQEL